jgi:hypothetical protein
MLALLLLLALIALLSDSMKKTMFSAVLFWRHPFVCADCMIRLRTEGSRSFNLSNERATRFFCSYTYNHMKLQERKSVRPSQSVLPQHVQWSAIPAAFEM